MKKYEVQMTMERIRDARSAAHKATRDINEQGYRSMRRLLFEAAINRMSVREVSKASGYSPNRVRQLMRRHGLDPNWSKTLLEDHAAKALSENAELLGIDPADMDLMSPLAYLPAGDQLRRAVDETRARGVTEIEPDVDDLAAIFSEAWHERDAQWRADDSDGPSERTQAGIRAVLKALA